MYIVVSEIQITSCFVDPLFIPYIGTEFCAPSSTKEQDARKGKWVKVGPNLNFQGYSYMVGSTYLSIQSERN
jgi:hypothetical protein